MLLTRSSGSPIVLVMAAPLPLHQLIGARLRSLREGAGLRQEDIATNARTLGFADWVRGTVAMIEGGRRRVALEEFLALPLILAHAGLEDLTLGDLVGEDVAAVINPGTALAASTLREILAGRPSHPSLGPPPRESVRDRGERQEADRLWQRWASGRLRHPRKPDAGMLDAIALEARSDAVVSAARKLGCSPVAASLAAMVRYGRLLLAERDDRVKQRMGEGTPDSRTVQAVRGHVTRELLDELRPIVQDLKRAQRTRR